METLYANLKDICAAVGIEPSELGPFCGFDPSDFERMMSAPSGPGLGLLGAMADRFDLPLDTLVAGRPDLDWVVRRWTGSRELPERYRAAEGSRLRTSLTILEYLRAQYGEAFYRSTYRALRVPPEVFTGSSNSFVSIRLANDMAAYLESRGLGASDFLEVGRFASRAASHRPVGAALEGIDTSRKLYDRMVGDGLAQMLDRNFTYRAERLRPDSMIVTTAPREERVDELGTRDIEHPLLYAYRLGTTEVTPEHLGLRRARVRQLASTHQGDSVCRFEVCW